jgi:hypothetical protein
LGVTVMTHQGRLEISEGTRLRKDHRANQTWRWKIPTNSGGNSWGINCDGWLLEGRSDVSSFFVGKIGFHRRFQCVTCPIFRGNPAVTHVILLSFRSSDSAGSSPFSLNSGVSSIDSLMNPATYGHFFHGDRRERTDAAS